MSATPPTPPPVQNPRSNGTDRRGFFKAAAALIGTYTAGRYVWQNEVDKLELRQQLADTRKLYRGDLRKVIKESLPSVVSLTVGVSHKLLGTLGSGIGAGFWFRGANGKYYILTANHNVSESIKLKEKFDQMRKKVEEMKKGNTSPDSSPYQNSFPDGLFDADPYGTSPLDHLDPIIPRSVTPGLDSSGIDSLINPGISPLPRSFPQYTPPASPVKPVPLKFSQNKFAGIITGFFDEENGQSGSDSLQLTPPLNGPQGKGTAPTDFIFPKTTPPPANPNSSPFSVYPGSGGTVIMGGPSMFDHEFELNIDVKIHGRHQRLSAKPVFQDPSRDIAILEVEDIPKNFKPKPVQFRDVHQNRFELGEQVFIVGSPQGKDFYVTDGIISSTDMSSPDGFVILNSSNRDREMAGVEKVATNADSSPGNSGGPMFDTEGLLCGMLDSVAIDTSLAGLPQYTPGMSAVVRADEVLQSITKSGIGIWPYAQSI